MKWARAKRAGSAVEYGLLSKIVDHIGAVAFPAGPIVGSGNGGIGRPHGRIRGWAAGGDLRPERCGEESGDESDNKGFCDPCKDGDDECHGWPSNSLFRRRRLRLLLF